MLFLGVDVPTDGRTPCVKLMITYLAGAWWVKKNGARRISEATVGNSSSCSHWTLKSSSYKNYFSFFFGGSFKCSSSSCNNLPAGGSFSKQKLNHILHRIVQSIIQICIQIGNMPGKAVVGVVADFVRQGKTALQKCNSCAKKRLYFESKLD